MAYLALIRHGTSIYNEKGLWTGWDDPELNEKGRQDAKIAGESLKDVHFDEGYISDLKRHKETLDIILEILKQQHVHVTISNALKERDYGDYTAKNKWDVKKKVGEKEFMQIRRGWDFPLPNGESLKQVYDREVPYYESTILPQLKEGKNIIIIGSGNNLRALVKYLEDIADKDISTIQIAPGEIYLYEINEFGEITHKEIRNHHELTV